MNGQESYKVAFIGSHGVGKTTLCYGLAARLKARDVSLEVVGEIARRCPLPINRGTTLAAQSWILHTQIAEELIAEERHRVVICDRSVLDNYIYLLLAAGHQPPLESLIAAWLETYDLLVHVPIIQSLDPDGFRSTDPAFQELVEDRLVAEIDRCELEVFDLGGTERGDWLDRVEDEVWRQLRPAQMELL